MPTASGVLVDASVWIRFFRAADAPESRHLDGLLQARAVTTCDPIRVEVCSGARTEHERARLRGLFKAVPVLAAPADVWDQIEDARFAIARRGHQSTLADLFIAAVAATHQAPLWTFDEDFVAIRHALPFPRYLPEL